MEVAAAVFAIVCIALAVALWVVWSAKEVYRRQSETWEEESRRWYDQLNCARSERIEALAEVQVLRRRIADGREILDPAQDQ